MVWRFDQGRLDYFNFDEIRRMAVVLGQVNGMTKPSFENDILREKLEKYSPRPFLPINYTVWRNYKRVFACALLATELNGCIVTTDLCNYVNKMDSDDYFAFFARKFYYPSPIFKGYNINKQQIFPIPAILKLILTRSIHFGNNYVSIDEIGNYLIANNITGLEPIATYKTLTSKEFNGDLRQTRELVQFISQFSFLKWESPNLFFDVSNQQEMYDIICQIEPISIERNPDPALELLNIASVSEPINNSLGNYTMQRTINIDKDFSEGNKIRVTHIRTERSIKLKEFYFKYTQTPEICDMCRLDTKHKYPWTHYIIDIHHLLPLSSPARVEDKVTSLQDIVGVCPTCHRAVHKYYHNWLMANGRNDFASKDEANSVYLEAKRNVVLEG
jgi:hypothetical protein